MREDVRGKESSSSHIMKEAQRWIQEMEKSLVQLRKQFHMYPEVGWTEFRTTAIVVSCLQHLGFDVAYGRRLYGEAGRISLPDEAQVKLAWTRAADVADRDEIDRGIVQALEGGFTGCVATWKTERPGPTIAFRVDIDALPIHESEDALHRPAAEGWRSKHDGVMHACGHDGHTAIGLGLAHIITKLSSVLTGTIKLIFQPAEEGGRGAASIVEAGHLDDVDEFVALHLGLGAPEGTVATGTSGLLATSKYRAVFQGVASHAGKAPQDGKNALLAAATATLNLHSLPQSGAGETRLNVGTFHAGTASNIIPADAVIEFEVRGENETVHRDLKTKALRVVTAAGHMYDVETSVDILGHTLSTASDLKLAAKIQEGLKLLKPTLRVETDFHFGASEDATLMMERVQSRGGLATLGVVGTELKGDHHQAHFDVSNASLTNGLAYFVAALLASGGED